MNAGTIFSAHDMLTMCMTLLSYCMYAVNGCILKQIVFLFCKSELYHLRAYFYKTTGMTLDTCKNVREENGILSIVIVSLYLQVSRALHVD